MSTSTHSAVDTSLKILMQHRWCYCHHIIENEQYYNYTGVHLSTIDFCTLVPIKHVNAVCSSACTVIRISSVLHKMCHFINILYSDFYVVF